MTTRTDFDVVVVGSGFGGSVMAYRLAAAGLSVCLLERGKAYPPGSFARSPHEMSANFWDPSKGYHGLFDVWSFRSIKAVVSSGLGGGSLIYANVLLRKPPEWFVNQPIPGGGQEVWPVSYEELKDHYAAVEEMMGVQSYPEELVAGTPKTLAMKEAAQTLGLEWQLPPLAVTFANHGRPPVAGEQIPPGAYPNLHGLPRTTCRLLGECDIGCNTGSKNSLDHTYLSAAKHAGAQLRTRSEVRAFQPIPGGYAVDYVEHDAEAEGRQTDTACLPVHRLTCRRLVLSAGTLGSTYLLLKNRSMFPRLSPMLGQRFSGNGDYLSFALRARRHSGGPRILAPSRGPVITSAARIPDSVEGGDGRGFYVQDAGYPEFVNWLVEESLPAQGVRLAAFLLDRALARVSARPNASLGLPLGTMLGRDLLTATSLPMLGIGRDIPDGRMKLRDGYLDLDWSPAASRDYFRRVDQTMGDLSHAIRARYWNPLRWLSKLITVHPLGGCPMGTDPGSGVVDTFGQVFGHPGLYVADGSVMPGPVGTNPSLTIAALAERFAQHLIQDAAMVPANSEVVTR